MKTKSVPHKITLFSSKIVSCMDEEPPVKPWRAPSPNHRKLSLSLSSATACFPSPHLPLLGANVHLSSTKLTLPYHPHGPRTLQRNNRRPSEILRGPEAATISEPNDCTPNRHNLASASTAMMPALQTRQPHERQSYPKPNYCCKSASPSCGCSIVTRHAILPRTWATGSAFPSLPTNTF